jgi:hypothetical protein
MNESKTLNPSNRRPDNSHADAEAEAMAMVNFIFAKPFSKGYFG